MYVHRAASTADLAEGLAVLLGSPLEDPFAEEVVAVPARGVERWLAQRLSHRLGAGPRGGDGVCAGVRFLNPHSLVAMVLGIERDEPWHPAQLAWPVLRAIDASLGEPWAATLSTHLGWGLSGSELELRRGRRYAVARRLAGLLADYAAQRPSLLTDWREGGHGDGLGGQVPEDLRWQPELYRRVLGLVDAEPPDVRQARVVQALEQGSGPSIPGLELPGRLSLFGHTRIARSEVEVLSALGRHYNLPASCSFAIRFSTALRAPSCSRIFANIFCIIGLCSSIFKLANGSLLSSGVAKRRAENCKERTATAGIDGLAPSRAGSLVAKRKADMLGARLFAVKVARRIFADEEIVRTVRASRKLDNQKFKGNFWRLTYVLLPCCAAFCYHD